MSSPIYPNSYTRKIYGQSGRALQRQRKSFMTEIERMKNEHYKSHEQQLKDQRDMYELRIKQLTRLFILIIAIVGIGLTIIFTFDLP